jgi:colicin import membrane protein
MAFEEMLEPDWFYELPFYLVATIAYGVLFTLDPSMRWGGRERTPDAVVPVEFVAQLPAPSPNLALAPGGDGKTENPPQKGPGEFQAEKVKAGAVDAPPKPAPKPEPAAVKSNREKAGATLTKSKAKPHPKVAAVVRPAVDTKAIVAASVARRQKMETQKAAKAAAAADAARRAAVKQAAAVEAARLAHEQAVADASARAERAADAKAAAADRARIAHEKAVAAAQAKAERAAAAKAAAQARAEAARVERERLAAIEQARQERLAQERAAKAAKKAELSQELATMADPDEALDQGADAPPPSGGTKARAQGVTIGKGSGGGRAATKAAAAAAMATDPDGDDDGTGSGPAANGGAALAGARKAGAAAALADTAESADPGDAAGSGGGDLLDSKAKGGGTGPDGSGVSYSLDGPVGSRRVLRRPVPSSPDWVGTRGLDLTVTVRFQVMPDGTVKPGAVIKKTSGFPDIDQRALKALRQWRFESVPDGGAEVWGRVTFRFTS